MHWVRRARAVWRRLLRSDAATLFALIALAVLLLVGFALWPRELPPGLYAPLLLLGGLVLRLRALLVLGVVVAGCLVAEALIGGPREFPPGAVGTIVLTGLIVVALARSRASLGVKGTLGESMLIDLRDRLRAQGELPRLPTGWNAEVVLRSAYGASFSGDFFIATASADATTVEIALVDVSGKGVAAGTRALLLSGAFGGLLGALPAEEFLAAANAYLLRQHWAEGFATAAHVVIDLGTGDYGLMMAGHPPAGHYHAGSGKWMLVEPPEGPLLGVIPAARYARREGRLAPGDALLLYTDGLIETPGRDLSIGIDRLLGEAERLVPAGFRHGAHKLVDRVDTGEGDDRALLLLWRT